MPSWNQIKEMHIEQIRRENRKLVAKVVLFRIILPAAAITAAVLYERHLDKKDQTDLSATEI